MFSNFLEPEEAFDYFYQDFKSDHLNCFNFVLYACYSFCVIKSKLNCALAHKNSYLSSLFKWLLIAILTALAVIFYPGVVILAYFFSCHYYRYVILSAMICLISPDLPVRSNGTTGIFSSLLRDPPRNDEDADQGIVNGNSDVHRNALEDESDSSSAPTQGVRSSWSHESFPFFLPDTQPKGEEADDEGEELLINMGSSEESDGSAENEENGSHRTDEFSFPFLPRDPKPKEEDKEDDEDEEDLRVGLGSSGLHRSGCEEKNDCSSSRAEEKNDCSSSRAEEKNDSSSSRAEEKNDLSSSREEEIRSHSSIAEPADLPVAAFDGPAPSCSKSEGGEGGGDHDEDEDDEGRGGAKEEEEEGGEEAEDEAKSEESVLAKKKRKKSKPSIAIRKPKKKKPTLRQSKA